MRIRALLATLDDAEPEVRAAAAHALRDFNEPSGTHLLAMLNDFDYGVQ
ncbi:MAG TPA: hypothetical protein VNH11_18880 [Pirellulales bacterium]|nr:hypothetical protein [Pirellulales bacterium]